MKGAISDLKRGVILLLSRSPMITVEHMEEPHLEKKEATKLWIQWESASQLTNKSIHKQVVILSDALAKGCCHLDMRKSTSKMWPFHNHLGGKKICRLNKYKADEHCFKPVHVQRIFIYLVHHKNKSNLSWCNSLRASGRWRPLLKIEDSNLSCCHNINPKGAVLTD